MAIQNGTLNGEIKDSLITGETSQGVVIHAALRRLNRFSAVFEVYGPDFVLRMSESLQNLKIVCSERTVYSGPAVIRNLVDAGPMLICEVSLQESAWLDLQLDPSSFDRSHLQKEFQEFVYEWQKLYKISPEFKIAVADMQSFLSDLRLWLEQMELNIRSQPTSDRDVLERQMLEALCESISPSLGSLFERFERVTRGVEKELQPAHALYAKRQLHPMVLCAPFMYRTFRKPLGYAGDYEMVNMMTRDSFQGGSVFAKVLNTFFLNTPPVVAHRNRIDYLSQMLIRETDRIARQGKVARVLNLGCGPALEIQAFLRDSPTSSRTDFTLLDFNDETVEHTTKILNMAKQNYRRETRIQVVKKSVAQLLKDQAKPTSKLGSSRFDIVYCAGLFDYLADPICEKLLDLFYGIVSPGGLVVATNVDASNPSQGWMEYMVDWHLCYRNSRDMEKILPKEAPEEGWRVVSDPTGVNVLVEIRKPQNA